MFTCECDLDKISKEAKTEPIRNAAQDGLRIKNIFDLFGIRPLKKEDFEKIDWAQFLQYKKNSIIDRLRLGGSNELFERFRNSLGDLAKMDLPSEFWLFLIKITPDYRLEEFMPQLPSKLRNDATFMARAEEQSSEAFRMGIKKRLKNMTDNRLLPLTREEILKINWPKLLQQRHLFLLFKDFYDNPDLLKDLANLEKESPLPREVWLSLMKVNEMEPDHVDYNEHQYLNLFMEHLPSSYKDDEDFMAFAIKINPECIEFASPRIQKQEIMIQRAQIPDNYHYDNPHYVIDFSIAIQLRNAARRIHDNPQLRQKILEGASNWGVGMYDRRAFMPSRTYAEEALKRINNEFNLESYGIKFTNPLANEHLRWRH